MTENHKKGGFEYDRYNITKKNGKPVDPNAQYIVLRIDKDPHARVAALAYAESVEEDNAKFAKQLRNVVDQYRLMEANFKIET